ncbi:SDR family oxidoreductase [Halalkalicoccus salilacus]|uniref:SDR family oxidoreductase n=1 Tax=Halalkalicoccus TaxID=332246 RepID=UPI0036178FC2
MDAFSGIDGPVNNVGIAGPIAPIEKVDREEWVCTIAVNAIGPFLIAKHVAPRLRGRDRTCVAIFFSISRKRPLTSIRKNTPVT